MVYSAAQLVRERGVTATGVRDVVDRAAAARGSFQHYFPGGKDQLVSEALLWSGDFAAQWVASYVDGARRPTPSGLFTHMVSQWKREFSTRGFERGCPVNAAAADLVGGDSPVNATAAEGAHPVGGRDRRCPAPDGHPDPARSPAGHVDALFPGGSDPALRFHGTSGR